MPLLSFSQTVQWSFKKRTAAITPQVIATDAPIITSVTAVIPLQGLKSLKLRIGLLVQVAFKGY